MTKGEKTRERILEIAEASVLQKGFAATSIDELTAAADITKSGFLYHFKDKTDLAKQLLVRYHKRDDEFFDSLFKRADELSDDPLQAYLIFFRLMAESLDDLPNTHPGCLAAAYSYQENLFNRDIRDLNKTGMLSWRTRFQARLERVAEKYPPKGDVDLRELADNVIALIEGGIVMSKAMGEKGLLKQQLLLGRDYIKRIFEN